MVDARSKGWGVAKRSGPMAPLYCDDNVWHAVGGMPVHIDGSVEGVDWEQAKADLVADEFDNGRSAEALRRSFAHSQKVAFAWDGDRVVGMARLLSDGVCNAYLLDVWT
ncbi:MAG: hypothetical protein ACRDU0_15625, partial [Mycobacterium sp.]